MVVEFRETAHGPVCSLGLRAALRGQPCLMPVAIWTPSARDRQRAREAFHLPTLPGEVVAGGNRWAVTLAGRLSFSALVSPASTTGKPAAPTPRWATFRHALSPDWTADRLVTGNAQLCSLEAPDAAPPAALDMAGVQVSGRLDGWLGQFGAIGPTAAVALALRPDRPSRFVQEVGALALEPFALRNYGGTGESRWTGADKREEMGARSELVLPDILVASVDCVTDAGNLSAWIPPPCRADPSGAVRVMTIRGLRDPKLDQAWLFARCAIEGRPAWYAVSHLAAALDGSEFGREVLGYPTKGGASHVQIGANRFLCSVQRGGTSLFQAHGSYGGFSTGTSLDEMLVATLRATPGPRGDPPLGEIALQQWFYQGLRKPVSRQSIAASFAPGPAGAAREAWTSIGQAHPYHASILDGGTMQRLPARVVAGAATLGHYYRDRCDGALPWEEDAPADPGNRSRA